jgi:hypothetical protein
VHIGLNISTPSLLSSKFLKLISDSEISRKGASWLYQLRSGSFPRNAYLHRFKKAESASCPACGNHNETTQHFLLDCPSYAHERWPLIAGKSLKNREYGRTIGRAQNAKLIIKFIMAAGRFSQEYTRRVGDVGKAGAKHGEIGVRLERQSEVLHAMMPGTHKNGSKKKSGHSFHLLLRVILEIERLLYTIYFA